AAPRQITPRNVRVVPQCSSWPVPPDPVPPRALPSCLPLSFEIPLTPKTRPTEPCFARSLKACADGIPKIAGNFDGVASTSELAMASDPFGEKGREALKTLIEIDGTYVLPR